MLDSLPSQFSRDEIYSMIHALQDDVEKEEPPMAYEQRVRAYSQNHKKLLFSMPTLYKSVLRGTYRPYVVETILDARDAMQRGQSKKEALDTVIRKAVDEVNEIRRNEKDQEG